MVWTWRFPLIAALWLMVAGCATVEGVYNPPPSPEPMGINFWWGSDPTCSPGCPPGATTGW
jgi:hypothetical protein